MAQKKSEPEPSQDDGPASSAQNGNRFFGWMRSLGIPRTDGWIGGVCAGIAARLGIDPLIVRGIAVVAAVLGAPVFLFYAAAWALLPDTNDRIHAERLVRGEFDNAMVGIGALALVSFLPFTQGVWWAGSQFWGEPAWPQAVGRSLWTFVVIGLIVAFVIWAARGAHWPPRGGSSMSDSRTASANPAAPGYGKSAASAAASSVAETATATSGSASTVASPAGAEGDAPAPAPVATEPALDIAAEPTEPPGPATDAAPNEYEAWKARHAAWQVEHNAWKARLDADMRAVRAQRSAENRERARAFAAEAEQRRREHRLANPRTSAAYVFATIGIGLVAAALTAILASGSAGLRGYEVTAALAVATIVLGLSGILAGVLKRRSGFLGFLSIVLVLVTVTSAFVPRERQLLLQPFGTVWIAPSASASYFQPFGDTRLIVDSTTTGKAPTAPVVDLAKGAGVTVVSVDSTTTIRLVVSTRGSVWSLAEESGLVTTPQCTSQPRGGCLYDFVDGPSLKPDVIVRIQQWSGEVQLDRSANTTGGQG